MHKDLLELNVAAVRKRVSEGDCPIQPPLTVEMYEWVIVDLADALANANETAAVDYEDISARLAVAGATEAALRRASEALAAHIISNQGYPRRTFIRETIDMIRSGASGCLRCGGKGVVNVTDWEATPCNCINGFARPERMG